MLIMTTQLSENLGLSDRLDMVKKYACLSHQSFLTLINLTHDEYEKYLREKDFPEEILYFLHKKYDLSLRWLVSGVGVMRSFGANNRLRAFISVNNNRKIDHSFPAKGHIPAEDVDDISSKKLYIEQSISNTILQIEKTLLPLRKTLFKIAALDTFEVHNELIGSAYSLLAKIDKDPTGNEENTAELFLKLKHLNKLVMEDQKSLLNQINKVQSTSTLERSMDKKEWYVHRKTV